MIGVGDALRLGSDALVWEQVVGIRKASQKQHASKIQFCLLGNKTLESTGLYYTCSQLTHIGPILTTFSSQSIQTQTDNADVKLSPVQSLPLCPQRVIYYFFPECGKRSLCLSSGSCWREYSFACSPTFSILLFVRRTLYFGMLLLQGQLMHPRGEIFKQPFANYHSLASSYDDELRFPRPVLYRLLSTSPFFLLSSTLARLSCTVFLLTLGECYRP